MPSNFVFSTLVKLLSVYLSALNLSLNIDNLLPTLIPPNVEDDAVDKKNIY